MTSGICEHTIELENLESGEPIAHSILLVKGQIKTKINHCLNVSENRCVVQHIHLRIRRLSACAADKNQGVEVEGKLARNRQFKLICDLHVYHDVGATIPLLLELNFCNCNRSWELVYQVRQHIDYYLQPLYIECEGATADEEKIREACDKIELNLRLVQTVYAEALRVAGFSRRTFVLDGTCKIFRSNLLLTEALERNEDELWQYFAKELLNSPIWDGNRGVKFVAFIGCTQYDGAAVVKSADFSYANIRRHLRAHAALGGGGLALFGTAHFYAWPRHFNEIIACFQNQSKVNSAQLPDDSNYRHTYGGVYATTLGSVIHEIGHTFDLGHTCDGVMGSGFDYVNRVFTVDNRTEHLPNRIVQNNELESPELSKTSSRPRFTHLKKSTNSFLDIYRKQKESDCFYFTRNCAIILAHQWWFSCCTKNKNEQDSPVISTEFDSGYVVSGNHEHPLRLIEVRCGQNSLVKYWYDIQNADEQKNCHFQLPKEALIALKQNHYLFVITVTGFTKRLCQS